MSVTIRFHNRREALRREAELVVARKICIRKHIVKPDPDNLDELRLWIEGERPLHDDVESA